MEKVKDGEIILFESDNSEIKVEPDSEAVKRGRGKKYQQLSVRVTCNVKEQTGKLIATTLDRDGEECQATLQVLGVDDPPVFQPPDDIVFTYSHFNGDPNRLNKAVLLVNLNAFTGMPEVTFWLEEKLGHVTLGGGEVSRLRVKVTKEHLTGERNMARLAVSFRGTGWGQRASLCAKAKRRDGQPAYSKCKLVFTRPAGKDKFSNFHYDDLRRNVLGDVAGDKLYINAGHRLHRQLFGITEDDFNKRLESDPIAQMRAASVLVETVVYHTATVRYLAGGARGLHIDPDDPIGSFRTYFDESRMRLELSLFKALAPDVGSSD